MTEYITDSEEDTIALGRSLAARMQPPLVVLLAGNLGTGKTRLAKGIVSGLGAAEEEEVTSPSFTLIHEYGRPPAKVYHVDLYRLESERDIATLGLEDLMSPAEPAIVLVEWGTRLSAPQTGRRWTIHIEDLGGDRRRILVEEQNG